MFKGIFFLFLLNLVLVGCKDTKVKNGIDLMKYGIPCTIQAPNDVFIHKIGSGTLANVNIKNNSGYDVQVFMGDALTLDMAKIKQIKKDQAIAHPNFVKIVEEYDSGFMYEKKNASSERSFDFAIVKIQGDKEITFEAGNSKPYSEVEIKKMVQSILSQ